jgi:hypothetical protein
MRKPTLLLISLLVIIIGLSSCGSKESLPETTVEKYLAALVNKDDALMISYVCPEFEFEALLEFDAFALVQTSLVDLQCEETAEDSGQVDIICQGSIEATYGNEVRNFDVSRRLFHLVEDNGEWLICGYDDIN